MFYKYQKYKKKYINIKNQVGGDCIISPDETDIITDNNNNFLNLKSAFITPSNINPSCQNSTFMAEWIFKRCFVHSPNNINGYRHQLLYGKNNLFPLGNINNFTNESLDINLLWNIIVNNNKYIIKLNDLEKIDYLYNETEINAYKKSKTFLYSNEDKEFIETHLEMLKKYNIKVSSYKTIPRLNEIDKIKNIKELNNELSKIIFTDDESSNHTTVIQNYNKGWSSWEFNNLVKYLCEIIEKIQKVISTYNIHEINIVNRTSLDDKINSNHPFEYKIKDQMKKQIQDYNDTKNSLDTISKSILIDIENTKNFKGKIDENLSNRVRFLISDIEQYIDIIINNNDIYRSSARKKYLQNSFENLTKKISKLLEIINSKDNIYILYITFILDTYFMNIDEKYNELYKYTINLLNIYNNIFEQKFYGNFILEHFYKKINEALLLISTNVPTTLQKYKQDILDKIELLNTTYDINTNDIIEEMVKFMTNDMSNKLLINYNYINECLIKYLKMFDFLIIINNMQLYNNFIGNEINDNINKLKENIERLQLFNKNKELYNSINDVYSILPKLSLIVYHEKNMVDYYGILYKHITIYTKYINVIHTDTILKNIYTNIKEFRTSILKLKPNIEQLKNYLLYLKKFLYLLHICIKLEIYVYISAINNITLLISENIIKDNKTNILYIIECINNIYTRIQSNTDIESELCTRFDNFINDNNKIYENIIEN